MAFAQCPVGTYNPDRGSNSSDDCRACPEGKANPVPGSESADVCKPCLPGSFADAPETESCELCPEGSAASRLCPIGAFCETESDCETEVRPPPAAFTRGLALAGALA